ncbi:MAG: GNAT family N-acetyltransferase [Saprospiraceae bacterium]|nr:GNAT family N-acetyltransferase [Saprospiraceae bacterium]
MNIRALTAHDFDNLIDCLLKAFEGYFVEFPTDKKYWKNRFKAARVDMSLCYAAFENERMIGFIITGVDVHKGKKTAFNSGTGVLKEFRGRKLVDQIYNYAFPHFRNAGIKKCMLEVITENYKAIRVYERIGFKIDRKLLCYSGFISPVEQVFITPSAFDEIPDKFKKAELYAWDHMDEAIAIAEPDSFLVKDRNGILAGYITLNTSNGNIYQIDALPNNYDLVLSAIALVSKKVKINNIDSSRVELIEAIEKKNLLNTINQWEMEMTI